MWSTIAAKIERGERLNTAEGVHLLTDAPLLELGALAHEMRARKTDPRIVTYVIANVIGNGSGVKRVIFRNACLNFSH